MKLVIVINGRGGVGKDTLCLAAAKKFKVMNVSSITPIKELAASCGWKGEKDNASRRFLSELKRVTIEYNDYPTKWTLERCKEFIASDAEVMFVHIREGAEIEKFISACPVKAVTLLIRGGKRFNISNYGNASDDDVENYKYDFSYVNDTPLREVESKFCAFLENIIRQVSK
ncbi:MAG: hypothetical protein ACI4TH_09090 [Candidatus Ornithomonoglobus sp.]